MVVLKNFICGAIKLNTSTGTEAMHCVSAAVQSTYLVGVWCITATWPVSERPLGLEAMLLCCAAPRWECTEGDVSTSPSPDKLNLLDIGPATELD